MGTIMTDKEILKLAKLLLSNSGMLSEASERREYLTDQERRELVRAFREAKKEGNEVKAQKIIEKLFAEVELLLYRYANDYSSGVRSKHSGGFGYSTVHNDAEELKTIGTIAFIKAVEGSEEKGTGFDPDGPGTFSGFMAKTMKGAMKNAHTYEKRHFGKEKTSIDAPRGEDEDTDMQNALEISTTDPELEELFNDEDEELYKDVLIVLDNISDERSNVIFKKYYGIEGKEKKTPTQLGEEYGVSKQRIDHIVKKLRNELIRVLTDD
jgi:RNA polymerase sigma factor (sigma-70 family)